MKEQEQEQEQEQKRLVFILAEENSPLFYRPIVL